MQIENTQAYIISGGTQPTGGEIAKEKPKNGKKKKIRKTVKSKKFGFALPIPRRFGRDMRILWKTGRKKIICTCAALAASVTGFSVLASYCTIGVNYYCNDNLICTVAASDDAAAIIGSALKKADMLGADRPEIETSAKIALKSSLVEGDEAVESILSAAPGLTRGYIVSVNGTDLFVTESRETVDSALNEYLEQYKINDTAELSSDIEIREKIVRKEDITPTDYIPALLNEGNVLTVMNTVDLTEQQTIAHETREIPDENMYVGESVVETPGADGASVMVDRQVYSNGELLSSAIISSEIITEPVTEVVRVGTKQKNALEEGLSYPVTAQLSSGFGSRWGRQHRGIDLAVAMNTPVKAAAYGTVITAEARSGYGNFVQIDHGYGIVTSYAHLNSIDVSVGQTVSRGDIIAHSGNTGNSTGPHLHFEVIKDGEYLDPLTCLK